MTMAPMKKRAEKEGGKKEMRDNEIREVCKMWKTVQKFV
jgi:hypothetical protein